MKVKPGEIASVLKAVALHVRVVLLYGRDDGLVRERAEMVGKQICPDLSDPFQVARPTLAEVKEQPSILLDEISAISMMGGRRLVRLEGVGNEVAAAVKTVLASDVGDGLIVITSPDLKPGSALRKACETDKHALAIACYTDSNQDLMGLIREILNADGLTADQQAVSFLMENLGSDRQVSRGELEKLVIYKGKNTGSVTLADVQAVVGDSATLEIGHIAAAVTQGDLAGLERALERALTAGESPIAILRVLQMRLQRLHLARGFVEGGMAAHEAITKLRPPVFFKERDSFIRLVGSWPTTKVSQALELLLEAEQQCKTTGMPAETITARALLRVARAARG